MKKIILLIPLIAVLVSNAQIALKPMLLSPSGDLGVLMKKRVTFELMYLPEFDESVRLRAGFSYTPLKPRMEEFPFYSLMADNSGVTVLPGFSSYTKCRMIYFFIGGDLKLIRIKNYSHYVGTDLSGGTISYNVDEYYPGFKESTSEGEGGSMIGFILRTGGEYGLNEDWSVFAEYSIGAYTTREIGNFGYYNFGIGVKYLFDN